MATIEVKVPDIGDFKDIPVIEVLVKPGDTVKAEDSLVTLESDKATMDVPSPAAGTVKELKVKVGDKVAEGVVVLTLDAAEAARRRPRQRRHDSRRRARRAPARQPPQPRPPSRRVRRAAPRRRPRRPRAGRRRGVPHGARVAVGAQVRARAGRRSGAGHGHRTEGPDPPGRRAGLRQAALAVRARRRGRGEPAAARSTCLPWPAVDFAKFGPVEPRPLSRIRKISGANLARNWVMIPHVTQFDEADITELEAFRSRSSTRSTRRPASRSRCSRS